MGEWIYDFKGRNSSLSINQNFLWRDKNIYVMDNHRAAMWCWLQHLKKNKKFGLFHIDAHYDTAPISNPDQFKKLINLESLSFTEYLGLSVIGCDDEPVPIIRWDNYLFIFQELYLQQIGEYFLATHEIGNKPNDNIQWEKIHLWDLPTVFKSHLYEFAGDGWLLNIDLDYFFSRQPESVHRLQSENYINEIFNSVRKALDDNLIACLTICLSPECCGGWANAEILSNQFSDILGIDFKLP